MKLEHISYLNINNSHLATKPLNVIHFKFIDPQFYQGRDKCVLQRNIVECESIFFFLNIYVIENIYIIYILYVYKYTYIRIIYTIHIYVLYIIYIYITFHRHVGPHKDYHV